MVEGIEVYGVQNLRETFQFIRGESLIAPTYGDLTSFFATHKNYEVDFSDVKGQGHVKRAIEVAVAGGHNLLMIGPPGSGKSMLSKRIATIMPPMSLEEAIESTKIHSISGMLSGEQAFVSTRPFRSPHHTISDVGLLGGSAIPQPGEVSLAHHGVLFLDELPEFKRSTLEVMRQPLEDGKVTVSRAAGSVTFPSEFMLVAAMNPCPCGYFGDLKRECRCGPVQVQRYRQRISGPLLDRIDLHIEVPAVEYRDISSTRTEEASAPIRDRVQRAREKQHARFHSDKKINCNARMGPRQIKQHCQLSDESQELIRVAMTELNLSARAYDRILKVSRTVADLESSDEITARACERSDPISHLRSDTLGVVLVTPAFCHSVQLRQRFVAPLEKRPADVLSVAHGHQPVRRVRIIGILTRDLFFNRPILLKQPALQLPELFDVSDVGLWRNLLTEEQLQEKLVALYLRREPFAQPASQLFAARRRQRVNVAIGLACFALDGFCD